MDSRTIAVQTFKKAILKENVEWTNSYQPKRITLGDIKSYWDNVDTKKLEILSTIKAEQ